MLALAVDGPDRRRRRARRRARPPSPAGCARPSCSPPSAPVGLDGGPGAPDRTNGSQRDGAAAASPSPLDATSASARRRRVRHEKGLPDVRSPTPATAAPEPPAVERQPPTVRRSPRPATPPTADREPPPPARLARRPQPQPRRPAATPAATPRPATGADDRSPTTCPTRHSRGPPVGRGRRAGAGRASRRSATPAGAGARRPTRSGGDGRRRRRRRRADGGQAPAAAAVGGRGRRRRRRRRRRPAGARSRRVTDDEPVELDDETLERRRGRERKGRPVGRYLCACTSRPERHPDRRARGPGAHRALRVAPGRRRQPDPRQHLPRPGPERAARHGGGVRRHRHAEERRALPGRRPVRPRGRRASKGPTPRIEQILQARQTILCQVTKNPIAHKGARLTQEVSLPGPVRRAHPEQHAPTASPSGCPTTSASACATILDKVKPAEHGADRAHRGRGRHRRGDRARRRPAGRAVGADRRAGQAQPTAPTLLYREPDMAVRVIREEFNQDYRGVVIDDRDALRGGARLRRARIIPDARPTGSSTTTRTTEPLPLFERLHVHEQLHKALDRKVWLPSGGSLIIEHTEALTVIDVNTGKNVGTSSLEETVFRNNLEAAEEIARQLRLRDIGGIIVIDFIDMEIAAEPRRGDQDVPRRPGPGQDPHPGVRHLRARPGRDDPQAHRRGPARVVRRRAAPSARAAGS